MKKLDIDNTLPIEQALAHVSPKDIKLARKLYAQPNEKTLAVNALHRAMFSEEHDHEGDSNLDALQRKNGISPMSDDYQKRTNKKRRLFGFDDYQPSKKGNKTTYEYCCRLCEKMSSIEVGHLVNVAKGVAAARF
jgi:hypothetical protein